MENLTREVLLWSWTGKVPQWLGDFPSDALEQNFRLGFKTHCQHCPLLNRLLLSERVAAELASIRNFNWPMWPRPLTSLPERGNVSFTRVDNTSTKCISSTTFRFSGLMNQITRTWRTDRRTDCCVMVSKRDGRSNIVKRLIHSSIEISNKNYRNCNVA